MIRRPPRSPLSSSSAASDVYKRQEGDQLDHVLETIVSTDSGMQLYLQYYQDLATEHATSPTPRQTGFLSQMPHAKKILETEPDKTRVQEAMQVAPGKTTDALSGALELRAAVGVELERYACAAILNPDTCWSHVPACERIFQLCCMLLQADPVDRLSPSHLHFLRSAVQHGGVGGLGMLLQAFNETERPAELAWLPRIPQKYAQYEVPDLATMLHSCLEDSDSRKLRRAQGAGGEGADGEGASAEDSVVEEAANGEDAEVDVRTSAISEKELERRLEHWTNAYGLVWEELSCPGFDELQSAKWFHNQLSVAILSSFSVYVLDKQQSSPLWESTGTCLLYTSPSPRDRTRSRMPSSA
eukprot:TRINITY_DN12490_c0_g1_i1.p1 TRINITY_DN12490_c0_g1~~TRINITY_DN12490_c0_g1_i1.p1  ORF type:complete len:357 (-),score=52.57 TRINITY_DN12490_c0_g1_i1:40-1110(-)